MSSVVWVSKKKSVRQYIILSWICLDITGKPGKPIHIKHVRHRKFIRHRIHLFGNECLGTQLHFNVLNASNKNDTFDLRYFLFQFYRFWNCNMHHMGVIGSILSYLFREFMRPATESVRTEKNDLWQMHETHKIYDIYRLYRFPWNFITLFFSSFNNKSIKLCSSGFCLFVCDV